MNQAGYCLSLNLILNCYEMARELQIYEKCWFPYTVQLYILNKI